MIKRIIGGLGLLGIFVGFVALRIIDVRFFDAFILILAVIAVTEVCKAVNNKNDRGNCSLFFSLLALVFGYILFVFFGLYMYFAGIALAVLSMLLYTLFTKTFCKQDLVATVFVMIYPVALFGFFLQINNFADMSKFASTVVSPKSLSLGLFALGLTTLISFGSDIFAFIFGMSLRKLFPKKLCPSVSPKKTVIGSIGGLVGGMIGAIIIFLFSYNYIWGFRIFPVSLGLNIFNFLFMGVVGSIFTQAGDLIASLVKRSTGIKDFGKVMLGHGGVMDRFDGLLVNAVFVFSYLAILNMAINFVSLY